MSQAVRSYFFDRALLSDGWHDSVRMDVDVNGTIFQLNHDAEPQVDDESFVCAIPGMPNGHSHAHQRAMAGLAERPGTKGDSFWTWRETMYDFTLQIGPEHLRAIASQVYLEMLKAGYTSVAEFHYLHHDVDGSRYDNLAELSLQTLAAARETGIGMTSLPVLYRYSGFGEQASTEAQRRYTCNLDEFLSLVEIIQHAVEGDSFATVGVAPHSLRAVSVALVVDLLDALPLPPSAPVHMHIAEQSKEVQDCLEWCGARPVAYLLDNIDLGPTWCLVHATHTDHDELARLAQSRAVVAVCPTTEANLGDGVFSAASYLSSDGLLTIGSDSNVCVNPMEELRWLEYAQRLQSLSRNVLTVGGKSTGRSLYEWALKGGARASGRPIGALATGNRADFVVPRVDHPQLASRVDDELLDSIVFAGNERLFSDVVVGGNHVIVDGHHVSEDIIESRFRRFMKALRSNL